MPRAAWSSIACGGNSVFLGRGIGSCRCIASWPRVSSTTRTGALRQPSRRCLKTSEAAVSYTRRKDMAKFKVVTHKLMGASFGVSGGGYKLEMEALAPLDAEIIEVPVSTEDEFIRQARDADAIIAKGVPIS